jgi:DNA-binding winged helix-turn-helix (wHTH) protein
MGAVGFGRCEFDRDRWELRRDGEVVALEPRAMQILSELVDRCGELVSKNDLLDRVWGDRFVSESALTTQVKALRRAVGDSGREQSVIKTVHGQGYRFVADVRHIDGPQSTHDVRPMATRRTAPIVRSWRCCRSRTCRPIRRSPMSPVG